MIVSKKLIMITVIKIREHILFVWVLMVTLFVMMVTDAGYAQAIIAPQQILNSRYDLNEILSVPIRKTASGNMIHRFHDTSPISPSGQYIALFRMPFADRYSKPGESGEVVLMDLKSGLEKVVGKSFGWEVQLGANVQWGADDTELFYNNVDTTNWEPYVVKYNVSTNDSEKIDGMVF